MNKRFLSLILFLCVFGALTLTSCNETINTNEETTEPITKETVITVETTKETETETVDESAPKKTVVVYVTKTTEKPDEEPLVIDKETKKTTTKKTTTTKATKTKKTKAKKETTIKTTKKNNKETTSFTYATAGEGNTAYSDAEGYWSPRY